MDEKRERWTKGALMRSFDYSKLYDRAWDTDILNLVAKIHECKGRQDLFIRQKPVELDRLVKLQRYRVCVSFHYARDPMKFPYA